MIKPIEYKGVSGVYKITQPDGKFYIGSSHDIYGRLRQHKSYSNKTSKYHKDYKFNYSFDDLECEILETCIKSDLRNTEQKYISSNWCVDILNIEKKSQGRNISKELNPNWGGGIPDVFCLDCNVGINYHSTKQGKRCKSCASKKRNRDKNKRKKNGGRFI